MSVRRVCLALLVMLVCSNPPALSATAPQPVPRYEADTCPFPLSDDFVAGRIVTCGYLIVPEAHSLPDGPTIRLLVLTLTAHANQPSGDPIVYLQGGPGGSVLSFLSQFKPDTQAQLAGDRDLIFLEQRGALFSTPALFCPDAKAALLDYAQ